MRQKHFIDSHKGATAPFVLLLMAYYDAWENPLLWLYLALHGTYGVLWVTKSLVFGDAQWERRTTPAFAALIWGSLSLYWIAPWLIASGRAPTPPLWYVALCVAAYGLGVFWHFASDMQKHLWLRLRPGELLQDGLWRRLRNPNYLGELLIYAGFQALAMHWLPIVALGMFVVAVWIPNMRRKDRSLSRYPEFAAYRARSWVFLPGIW